MAYNCYRASTCSNNAATIHAEHYAINKLKTRPKNKKLYKISIVVIKVSPSGLIGMSKPCKHCVENMQKLANRKKKQKTIFESLIYSIMARSVMP